MNYNDFYLEGTKWIGAMCKEGVAALGNRHPLFSGLFICPNRAKKASEPDPENHGLVMTEPVPQHGRAQSLSLTLPPLGILLLKRQP